MWRRVQVLGRSEFKQLLRWRLALRKDLKADLAAEEEAAKVGGWGQRWQQVAGGARHVPGTAKFACGCNYPLSRRAGMCMTGWHGVRHAPCCARSYSEC